MEALLFALAGGVALLGLAAIALSGRRAIFWLAFGATLVPIEFVGRYYVELPGAANWLPELALLVAAAASVVLYSGAKASVPRRVLWVYAAIVAEALLSLAFNRSSLTSFVLTQRGYVLFFASILALQSVRGLYDKDRLYSVLVGAGIASSVVCLVQRLTIARAEPDRVTGLFSFGEVVMFYHLVCIAIVLAYWLEGRRVGRWNAGGAIALLVLSLAIGNQEAALPYFAMILLYLFFRARARRGALLTIGLALPAAMLIVFTVVYDTAYVSREGSYARAIFDPAYLKRYFLGERHDVYTPSGDLLRGAAIVQSYREVSLDVPHLLLGRGPGASAESGIAGSGQLALEFPGIGRVMLSLLIADTGLLGVLLYLAFLFVLLRTRPPPGLAEPYEHALVRELVLLLVLAYFVYARLAYEPCCAWILASLLQPAYSGPPASSGARSVPA